MFSSRYTFGVAKIASFLFRSGVDAIGSKADSLPQSAGSIVRVPLYVTATVVWSSAVFWIEENIDDHK
jgi:hypothetical protein